jgi:O-antigen/teichoic acid export membrane protein
MTETLTVDETSFPNAKPHSALLIAYKAFADLAGKGSLFVITIVAARRLSANAFGVFALGSTLGWMVAVVTDGGIQLHLARAVARRPEQAATLLREWLRVRVWTTAIAITGVGVGLAVGRRGPSATPIAILVLIYACSGLIELLHYFYRGLSRSEIESSLTLWQRGGTLACGLIALALTPDVTWLAIAMLAPVAATLAWSVRIAARMVGSRPDGGSRSADLQGRSLATFRRDIWPIGAGIVLSALYFRIDVFLVQLWSGTESVALYNAVFRLVEALRLFPAAVLAVMLPALIRAGDLRPLARVAMPVTAFAIAASAVLWLAAGWLIPWLYGEPYAAAVPAFRVLLLSFPLLSLNLALTHQLIGWDGQRVYAGLCALALAVNVGLNALLIPIWSIEGAAWTTLVTELVLTAGCAIALWIAHAPARTPGAHWATES